MVLNSKSMATSDDVAASYLSRLDAFRRSDQDRDEMVRELIKKCTELADRYEKKNAQFESELETRLMWQKASKAHEQELTQLKTANVRFVFPTSPYFPKPYSCFFCFALLPLFVYLS